MPEECPRIVVLRSQALSSRSQAAKGPAGARSGEDVPMDRQSLSRACMIGSMETLGKCVTLAAIGELILSSTARADSSMHATLALEASSAESVAT